MNLKHVQNLFYRLPCESCGQHIVAKVALQVHILSNHEAFNRDIILDLDAQTCFKLAQ